MQASVKSRVSLQVNPLICLVFRLPHISKQEEFPLTLVLLMYIPLSIPLIMPFLLKTEITAITVNTENVKSQWSHLADLELEDVDGAEFKVVLGRDVTEIVIPREVRKGPKGSPYGVKIKLVWTVTESLPGYVRNSESVYVVHVASPEK